MSFQDQQEAIKNRVSSTASDVSDRVSSLADRAQREGSKAKNDIVNAATDIAQRATDALNDAGVDTDTIGKALSNSLDSISKSVRSAVRDRPLGALAITAAIGLLLGAMSNR